MTNIRCGGTTFHLSYCQHLKVSHASFVKWVISSKETTYPSEVKYMFNIFNIFKSSSILLTEIFIMETICVLQCQDLTQHVSISYYQVLFLKYYNTQITASIYAKNSTHWNGHCQCRLCKWWMFLSLCLCYVWYWEVATAKGRFIRQRGSSHSATPYYWLLQCIIIYL